MLLLKRSFEITLIKFMKLTHGALRHFVWIVHNFYLPCFLSRYFLYSPTHTHTCHRQIFFINLFDFCSRHIFEYLFDNIKADFYFRYFYRLNLIFILHLLEQVCERICVYISILNILCVYLIFIVDSHDNDWNKNFKSSKVRF
jgi:hypothetical protein